MNYQTLWIILLVAFAGIEGVTAGLVSIWFAAGSLAGLVATWLGASLLVQIAVFAIVSVLTMALVRPLAKKWVTPGKLEKTNVDSVLDQEGVVVEAIDNLNAHGQVKIGGIVWTARSATGEPIPLGATVKVARIEGVKAIVTVSQP